MTRWPTTILVAFLAVGVTALGLFVFLFRPNVLTKDIPNGWGRWIPPEFVGTPARRRSLPHHTTPHPFLAATNASTMHVDGGATDVHARGGPLGFNPLIRTYAHGRIGGECATITFDSQGNIIAVCATFKNFAVLLLDPSTLRPLAELKLPPRSSNKTYDLKQIMTDTSGGAYFFLDQEERVVLVDADQRLRVIGQHWSRGSADLVIERELSLAPIIDAFSTAGDVITAVLPDYNGLYWFVSREGLIGTLDPRSGHTRVLKLDGEEIQNSFAVGPDAVYIVSDRALYALKASPTSTAPVILWREEYERAKTPKPGSITRGSGTTPTLLAANYVAIADNADPQIHVVIYRRDPAVENRLVCKVPVFPPGASATENTLISYNNSVIIENNYGYTLFPFMILGRSGQGGVTRIDVVGDEGAEHCEEVWTNHVISQTTVPKLSAETGLVYLYAKSPVGWAVDAFYLTAIDFRTGSTVFQVLTGTGMPFDNNWAPIALGPDRCAYVGVLRGLLQVCDGN